ncbi:hypothetical protein GCM10027570_48060 [Streptomonospora sediminis]
MSTAAKPVCFRTAAGAPRPEGTGRGRTPIVANPVQPGLAIRRIRPQGRYRTTDGRCDEGHVWLRSLAFGAGPPARGQAARRPVH